MEQHRSKVRSTRGNKEQAGSVVLLEKAGRRRGCAGGEEPTRNHRVSRPCPRTAHAPQRGGVEYPSIETTVEKQETETVRWLELSRIR